MRSVPALLAVCSLVGCGRADAGDDPVAAARPGAPPLAVPAPAAPLRIAAREAPVAEVPAPPFTLTASDGSGLELTRIDARVIVEGPLAFTELHLDFHNPEDRVREGTFAITLPAGASVSRFAMEIDGRWQESAVVPRMVARRAYDDFLHRKQDPALLEKAAGNQFTARVFPIPARADKHLVISFSQALDGRPYTLPLRGLPRTARVDVAADAARADGSRGRELLAERDWQPDRDFVVAAPTAAAVAADGMAIATVAYQTGAVTIPLEAPRKLIVAIDTSASRALGYRRYLRSLREMIGELRARHGDAVELQVLAFDQDVQPIYDGPAAGYGDDAERKLLARGAAGASNLEPLLAALARSPRTAGRRLAIVTDGVMTAGAEPAAVIAAAGALPLERIDVVLAGGLRDRELPSALVRARPRAGDVFDADEGAAAIVAGLGEPVAVDVAVSVPGATWVYPPRIPSLRPGRPVTVHARVPRAARSIELVIGGRAQTLALAAATPALVGRAVAAAELDERERRLLTSADATEARALREDIARRSVAARVLSSQTSMLVLETEEDYARYGIERDALADLLVVGDHGLEIRRPAALADRAAGAGRAARPSRPTPARGRPLLLRRDLGDAPVDLLQPPADRVADAEAPDDDDDDERGAAMALDEGRMGRADRADELDRARTAGVLGSAELLIDEGGAGAAAVTDVGSGGGGTGWGTIGLGRHGAVGRGAGSGSGYGVGGGRGGMRGRTVAAPRVSLGRPTTVQGSLDTNLVRRTIRRALPRIRYCYERELVSEPTLAGTVSTRFTILPDGHVAGATASGLKPAVASCVATALDSFRFPAVAGGGAVQVGYPFAFSPTGGDAAAEPPAGDADDDLRGGPPALTGELADVMAAIAAREPGRALGLARGWHDRAPGDVLALIALGEAQEASRDLAGAARSYGSLIDLFPGRADLRRFAGERLERLGAAADARALAIDTYRKAVADRPDHLTGHRLLAYALLRAGDHAGAFVAILAGVDQPIGDGRFAGADRILDEDAGMIAAVWLAAGGPRAKILAELEQRDLAVATRPSTRAVLYWETDANDVDLHIRDRHGDHAYYSNRELASGGSLYADVTTGYGPECFTIPGKPEAGPYRLAADYYARGPMGYGMGLLQVQRFDGKALTFDDRPFVIMNDHAMIDLGEL